MREMARTEREVEEKRAPRGRGLVVANVADRMIHQVRAEVILLARSKMDRTVIAVELRIPLVRERAVKAVPPGEIRTPAASGRVAPPSRNLQCW